ncbi:SRPBCC family protein [Bacteroidota bacterium]
MTRPIILLINLLVINIISSPVYLAPEPDNLFYFEQSIVIEKPIQKVWAYLDDLDNSKDYLFFLKEVNKNPDGPNSVETEFEFQFSFLFKKYTNYYEMEEYKPPYTFSFKTVDGSAIEARGTVILNGIDKTSTELTIIYSPELSRFFSMFTDEQVDFIYSTTLTRVLSQVKKNVNK